MRSPGKSSSRRQAFGKIEARAKAERFLDSLPHTKLGRRIIQDELTEDHELFWLFWWYPARCRNGVGGNCPVAVSKADGQLYVLGARTKKEKFAEELGRGAAKPIDFA